MDAYNNLGIDLQSFFVPLDNFKIEVLNVRTADKNFIYFFVLLHLRRSTKALKMRD